MGRYPFWSYLSIIAIDAPIISISWHLYFVQNSINSSLNVQHCVILWFSVWLGYMADRLFDVRFKKKSQLISLRHRFCKENEFKLWIIWAITLLLLVIFSLNALNSDKIFACFIITILIILYNYLNQYFSRERFPKEICIAALFAYGTLFLIEGPLEIKDLTDFTLICFLNCLILTHKDRQVDNKMGVKSWTYPLTKRSITMIIVLVGIYFLIAFRSAESPFFAICIACLVIHNISKNLNIELFRVAIEGAYTLIPLIALISQR